MSIKLLEDSRVGEMNAEQHKLVDNVKEESARILKITSELLDLAQVETGNLQLHYMDVNPIDIIAFAYDALKFQAEQKNVKMEVNTHGLLPKVKVDVEKTTWVMINLMANALRYSAEMGRILIEAQEKNGFVEFSVKDFGPGIDEKYRDKIFDKFFKVPGSDTSKSGTGLGLAISKEFIIAQGGRIWVESEVGKGSKFIFALPVNKLA
jgi:NtrC-family two-component system sensor histidine kinase KinB